MKIHVDQAKVTVQMIKQTVRKVCIVISENLQLDLVNQHMVLNLQEIYFKEIVVLMMSAITHIGQKQILIMRENL